MTKKKRKEKDLWSIVKKQEKKHGSINTPEINWGKDVGEEKIQ